ncbi:hypothetical protein RA086_10930 [Lactiplantibacillus sp. WILCCON 0030]|uniref:Extracellular protein n=1 Tax=Lactiplantibacillus brownii TaxID=3069269 RepID=A0ABU1ACS7_9LACO|nr:hypothetical protein [Lactiplantibacillus brownii]MDQ7938120.1 hypothetical protein [Lactiplantibacillus brownii]
MDFKRQIKLGIFVTTGLIVLGLLITPSVNQLFHMAVGDVSVVKTTKTALTVSATSQKAKLASSVTRRIKATTSKSTTATNLPKQTRQKKALAFADHVQPAAQKVEPRPKNVGARMTSPMKWQQPAPKVPQPTRPAADFAVIAKN